MSMNTLGERIKYHRKRLGLTQEQLADRLGVSPQAVSKWENNLSCPDISLLPELAGVLGISVDELLGKETTAVKEKKPNVSYEFRWNENFFKRWNGILFPLFVMLFGGLWLVNVIFRFDVSCWTLLWTLSLMYFGVIGGRYMLIVGLTGAYYLLSAYDLIRWTVGWEIVVPIVILLWGLGLLLDIFCFRRKKYRVATAHRKEGHREFRCENGRLHCEMSFGSDRIAVREELLNGGEIETGFGQFTVDFSPCMAVAPGCRLKVENSFGSLTLLVPARFQVHIAESENFFSGCTVKGGCDDKPAGDIFLEFENSFGSLTIQYMET